MTSHRPYLLRALYEWVSDNGLTPHLLVDATQPGVRVPAHTINEGKVVLNIAARAVAHLSMDNDAVAFTARLAGVSQDRKSTRLNSRHKCATRMPCPA